MAARRWIKRAVIALVAIIVLLFAAVVTALALVDTQALKGVIENRVEAATGRQLRIEGSLDISVFPWLGFELGHTELANAKGFGDRPFAALDRAELRVRILPLFQRRVAVDTVVLHGLALNLARNQAGKTNWADLAGASKSDGESGQKADPPADSKKAAGNPASSSSALGNVSLRVEGIELRDASLNWRDATTGQAFSVRHVDLTTGILQPKTPTHVHLSLDAEQEGGPKMKLQADTALTFDPDAQTAALRDLVLDLTAKGDSLPGGTLSARVNAGVNVDAAAGQATIDPLSFSLLDTAKGSGHFDVQFGESVPSFAGHIALASFSPRALLDQLDIDAPDTSDDKALGNASLKLDVAGTPAKVDLSDVELKLDDTTMTGEAHVALGSVPSVKATCEIDGIDVDRYLPKAAREKAPAAAVTTGAGPDPIASIPLEPLRGVDAEGHVSIGRLGYRGLDMKDVRLDATLKKGVLDLQRLRTRVAGGRIDSSGRFDASTDTPKLSLATSIDAVQAEPLLKAFLGSAPVLGRLDSKLNVDTGGKTLDAWTRALNGHIGATFTDGAVQGFNIAQSLRTSWARLKGENVKEAESTRRTDFSALAVDASIRKGVVHTDKLDMQAPLLRVRGDGDVNLPDRSLDYTAHVLVTGTLKGQGGASADELRGLEIPVRLKGPLSSPKVDIALGDALKAKGSAKLKAEQKKVEDKAKQATEAQKEKIEQQKKEAEQKAKKKLEDKLKKLIQ